MSKYQRVDSFQTSFGITNDYSKYQSFIPQNANKPPIGGKIASLPSLSIIPFDKSALGKSGNNDFFDSMLLAKRPPFN